MDESQTGEGWAKHFAPKGSLSKASIRMLKRPLSARNKSGYRGVSVSRILLNYPVWQCQLSVNREPYWSYHPSKETAALAYNDLAIQHHGEHAQLNDVPAGTERCWITKLSTVGVTLSTGEYLPNWLQRIRWARGDMIDEECEVSSTHADCWRRFPVVMLANWRPKAPAEPIWWCAPLGRVTA